MMRRHIRTSALAAATAIAAGPVWPALVAHAAANCTVPGAQLTVHHSSGYDVAVDASGASLGPRASIQTAESTSEGNVSGSITGRAIDFTITFTGTKAYVHFTGTAGPDGIAHGTSTGTTTPIALNEGQWDSVGPLVCS